MNLGESLKHVDPASQWLGFNLKDFRGIYSQRLAPCFQRYYKTMTCEGGRWFADGEFNVEQSSRKNPGL